MNHNYYFSSILTFDQNDSLILILDHVLVILILILILGIKKKKVCGFCNMVHIGKEL